MSEPPRRLLLAHPGTGRFVQEVALALHEGDMLERFATTVVDDPGARWRRLVTRLPLAGARVDRELRRRAVPPWLRERSVTYPYPELARVTVSRLDRSGVLAHRLWEHSERAFDRWVASTQLEGVAGLYGYENAALFSLRAARERKLFSALDLPAFAQEHTAQLFARELARWPELATPYLRTLADARPTQAAVIAEQIALASCVIANSRLTLQSYRKLGYGMEHAVVVPLAAPEALDEALLPAPHTGPLRVLFAGTLDVRKGGHYLLEAFRTEPALRGARLSVCGHVGLAESFVRARSGTTIFRGHLPAAELKRAYLEHDVLVLPTLSDGFGLVVTEAQAHGLPVITTDQCGAAERIEPGVNGWVIGAADLDALRGALAECVRNRDALHAMRGPALASARAYGWVDYRRRLRETLAARLQATGPTK